MDIFPLVANPARGLTSFDGCGKAVEPISPRWPLSRLTETTANLSRPSETATIGWTGPVSTAGGTDIGEEGFDKLARVEDG